MSYVKLADYDIDEGALDLKVMMDGVLSRVVAIFESYGVPLPARRYWMMGQPAIDCEQIVVSFVQMYLGSPGDQANEPRRCNNPRSATLNIMISRQVPTVGTQGRAPLPEKISESSEIAAVDAWVLMQSINDLDQWDDTGYGLGVIATLSTDGPEGGYYTNNLEITMAVP
jgi:hypothetical protein